MRRPSPWSTGSSPPAHQDARCRTRGPGGRRTFLLTHHGQRVTVYLLRDVLTRVCRQAAFPHATPHQLRHTYTTALVNAGVSLQA
jgi:site-specific recombinase XerD